MRRLEKRWLLIVLMALSAWMVPGAPAADGEPAKVFEFKPLEITQSIFGADLDMLDRERDEYATNLAIHAANRVAAAGADAASLDEARKMLAVARHLAPRNRRALVVSFQLARGILPEVSEGDYSKPVMARLLVARAQLLDKQANASNQLASRCFIELAVALDPRNEDVAYAFELKRLDGSTVDWKKLTDPPAAAAEPSR